MPDNVSLFRQLLHRYIDNRLSEAEEEIFFALLNRGDHQELLQQTLDELFSKPSDGPAISSERLLQIQKHILAKAPEATPTVHRISYFRRWWWAAASVILVLGIGAYFLAVNEKKAFPTLAAVNTGEIRPGKEGAVLTLADGSEVVLDSLGNGVVALQNGSQAIIRDGQLIYGLSGEMIGEAVYNTMTTCKGRQFSLVLPDGTHVWLNSASSIRYPTVFAAKERKVEIEGEAYFEVAKNEKVPFRVKVNGRAEVEVLGTRFNVNAYENEATINTTLLQGVVKVNGTIIKAGQQAQVVNTYSMPSEATTERLTDQDMRAGIRVVSGADIEKVMAWKNGLFNFNGLTFDEIMRQLERWYDIEVVYENDKVPPKRLVGKMTRDVPLNGLLKNLKEMGVHYKLNGRVLFVLQ